MHILKAAGRHLAPNEVYELARQTVPGVTEATVYRTLEFLAENAVVQPALNEKRHVVYEMSGNEHHHLICSACGAQVDIEPGALQQSMADLEKQSGYIINASHITFFGLCPNCQEKVRRQA